MHEGSECNICGSGKRGHRRTFVPQKRQNKIDAQATEIAAVKSKLNKALEENKKLKDLFSPETMVEAMTKAVSAMTVQGTQRY